MNSERLHAIAFALCADLMASEVISRLDQIAQFLTNVIGSPATPTYQEQLSQAVKTLLSSLDDAEVNRFSPTWKQALDELGATELVGNRLAERINEIFSRNYITPSVALQEVQQLATDVRGLLESLGAITNAFAKLGIGKEDLSPGECELGVLVPRLYVNNLLGEFAEELKDLNQLLGVFSEISTGSRSGFEIKTISSTDLSVFLQVGAVVAAAIATAIERIVALYKTFLEVRKLKNDLSEQGVSKMNLAGIENHATSIMKDGIENLLKEILKTHKANIDSGRKNELEIELRLALNGLASRIDRGFNFEVRMEEPDTVEASDDSEKNDQTKLRHYFETIASATESMQFLKLDGDPILKIEDGKANKAQDTTSQD
jgi:hypothetical protein